ncbi:MAG: hypothetical protein ACKO2P_14315 [Planctomycetota bacterium]
MTKRCQRGNLRCFHGITSVYAAQPSRAMQALIRRAVDVDRPVTFLPTPACGTTTTKRDRCIRISR